MKSSDCPYNAIDRILPQLEKEADIIVVDFHAEATSEKENKEKRRLHASKLMVPLKAEQEIGGFADS